MDRRPEFTALLKTLKRRVGKQSSATQQPEQGGRNGNSRIILESATAVRDDVHGLHTYLIQNARWVKVYYVARKIDETEEASRPYLFTYFIINVLYSQAKNNCQFVEDM